MIDAQVTTGRICKCVALVALLSVASCGGIQNAINPAGPQASNISEVWWLMFVVCSVVFVLVMIAVLLALRKRHPESQLDATPMLDPPPEEDRAQSAKQ